MPTKRGKERSGTYRVRRELADGSTREYVYERTPPKRKGPRYAHDALARVIEQWQRSPEWKAYAPATVRRRHYGLAFLDAYRRWSIRELTRALMLEIRDDIAEVRGNGAAGSFIDTASALFTFALDRGHRTDHPLIKIKRLKLGEWRAWTDEEIAVALERFPAYLRRAVVLGLYTGQRSGDCARMRWGDFDGEGIAVAQQKTGEKLWIPCHTALKAEIADWPREAMTILATTKGQPWTVPSFQQTMHREIKKIPEMAGLQFHGLRKSAATRLAEAGCTDHEISAVTGHQTLAMVQHYTKAANQRKMATAAIIKLQDAKRERRS